MSVWRVMVSMVALLAAFGGLGACSSTASALDTLTLVEPDSTRQRAMRRLSLASAYFEQNQNESRAIHLTYKCAALDPGHGDCLLWAGQDSG
jgi:hypothetical protein